MVEHDVVLDMAQKVNFVKHHENQCNVDYRTCPYRGRPIYDAGADFLAVVASNNSNGPLMLPGMTKIGEKGPRLSRGVVSDSIAMILNRLDVALSRATTNKSRSTLRATDSQANAVARALLRTLADRNLTNEREQLASLFENKNEASTAVKNFLASALGLPDVKAMEPY
jgi:hypothetical protein